MYKNDCIFCKIIQKKISSEFLYENEHLIVIKDIQPKATYHYLLIPKKHIININYLRENELFLVSEVVKISKQISLDIQKKENKTEPISFNLISNNGRDAGQSVFHIHWHFISGKNLYDNGLQL